MPEGTRWALARLGQAGRPALRLELANGVQLAATSLVATWAVNEIPSAVVGVPVGLKLPSGATAPIHLLADQLRAGIDADVYLDADGEASPGVPWPDPVRIFRGQLAGDAARMAVGQAGITLHLAGWQSKLGYSSSLTAGGHVANHAALNAAAVLQSLQTTRGEATTVLASMFLGRDVAPLIATDLWGAVKLLFTRLAQTPATAPIIPGCLGLGGAGVNAAALEALALFEGGDRPYTWGVPLKPVFAEIAAMNQAVAEAITGESLALYANVSLWDKLVTGIAPSFMLAVVPRVETSLVVADTRAYSGGVWRELDGDYHWVDFSGTLERPLRGVAAWPGFASDTQAALNTIASSFVGACYLNPEVPDNAGAFLVIPPPPWLLAGQAKLGQVGMLFRGGGGTDDPPDPNAAQDVLAGMFQAYAKAFYYDHFLRGRAGVVSGPLRFDIAPGSIVRTAPPPSRVGMADVAGARVGHVQRVTVAIDTQAPSAVSSFEIDHVRSPNAEGTSTHYLFGGSIHGGGKHGCPLIDEFDNPFA